MEKDLWFMDIEDKVPVGGAACCPPHYIPHKLPFGPKVVDEPCHFHKAPWRMAHHTFFCRWLKCPHAEDMLRTAKKVSP